MPACLRFALPVLALAAFLPAEEPPDLGFDLSLRGALCQPGREPDPDGPALLVDCRRTEGRWGRLLGLAPSYNIGIHPGRVTGAELGNDRVVLELDFEVVRDAWVPGGRASYRVELTRTGGGDFTGTWTGTFNGRDLSGPAAATRYRPSAGGDPPEPREHPRLLFRRDDLPALRERANTPFGKACVARMGGAVGHGVRYQLTGDAGEATKALAAAHKLMADKGLGSEREPVRPLCKRMERVAIAFDSCYDAWSDAEKAEVLAYLRWGCDLIFYRQHLLHRHINWHVSSNYAGPIYAGPGVASLAFWGEPGPAPEAPVPSDAGATVTADPDFEAVAGVPVHPFADGRMPTEWLYAGGLPVPLDHDPFPGATTSATARPAPGDRIKGGGDTDAFRALSHEKDRGYWSGQIDVTNAIGREYDTTTWFHCVIDNDRERWVKVETGYHSARSHLGGARLGEGGVVKLGPGRHPWLVAARIGWMNPWGRHLMRPRLTEIDAETARERLATIRAVEREEREDYEFDLAEWRRLDGADQELLEFFAIARRYLVLHYREAMGDGGFQAEVGGYSAIASNGPDRYASYHRTMFGRDASAHPDVTHYLPRKLMPVCIRPDGEDLVQDINGTPAVGDSYFHGLFPIVPDRLKPGVHWFWNRRLGVDGARPDPGAVLSRTDAVTAFLRYPYGREPAHPGECFPLTWTADDAGYYVFRDGWGPDACVLQVFAKAHTIGGWAGENAGTFRLLGLGHVWAFGPTDRNRYREEENVVLLPAAVDHNVGALGRVAHRAFAADGSGSVAIDLADVYAGRRRLGKNKKKKAALYEKYGNLRRDEAFVDLGISGRRAIAVDYGGGSGATCLLAIVDAIDGVDEATWLWQLGPSGERGHLDDTRCAGNAFTVAKADGTTLRATFVTGQEPEARVREFGIVSRAGSKAGKTLERAWPGVQAAGDGDFFVVVTLGRGAPPPVRVAGAGLDAVVTVGERTVRYVDGRVVIE